MSPPPGVTRTDLLLPYTPRFRSGSQQGITQPGAASRKLTFDQRDAIILKLKSAKAASFHPTLARFLKLADGESFNKASDKRTGLTGDEIFAAFSHKNCFGPRWAH